MIIWMILSWRLLSIPLLLLGLFIAYRGRCGWVNSTESPWAAACPRAFLRARRTRISCSCSTATAAPPLSTELPPADSLSSRWRSWKPLPATSAPKKSSLRAARKRPMSSTKAACRTSAGSLWRNLPKWRGLILNSSRYESFFV